MISVMWQKVRNECVPVVSRLYINETNNNDMTKITIEVHNEEDKRLLIDLIQRMNLQYHTAEKESDELVSIIDRGGDGKSIKDPVSWQKKERKDRKLPFKE
jgi:hypothetical protein